MLALELERWSQTPHDLHRLSIDAPHPRTRERFAWLFQCTQHRSSAEAAEALNIHRQTMLKWLHRYNERGPDALTYARSGGRSPLMTARRKRGSKHSFNKATTGRRSQPR